jgi:hypothetical protein
VVSIRPVIETCEHQRVGELVMVAPIVRIVMEKQRAVCSDDYAMRRLENPQYRESRRAIRDDHHRYEKSEYGISRSSHRGHP